MARASGELTQVEFEKEWERVGFIFGRLTKKSTEGELPGDQPSENSQKGSLLLRRQRLSEA